MSVNDQSFGVTPAAIAGGRVLVGFLNPRARGCRNPLRQQRSERNNHAIYGAPRLQTPLAAPSRPHSQSKIHRTRAIAKTKILEAGVSDGQGYPFRTD